MKEVEILITFDNTKEEVLNILSSFEFIEEKEILDIYYEDPKRDNLKPEPNLRINEIFRLRKKGNQNLLTYKKNHFEKNRWIYSDEYETTVADYEKIKKIIENLGFEIQIVVKNKRKIYRYKDYEITLEEVEKLGLFIEVERMLDMNSQNEKVTKNEIREFIKSLNLKNVKELDLGKNQLMLRKKLNRDDIDIYI